MLGRLTVLKDFDAAVLARLVDGDESGLAVLYDRHATAVYSLALRIVRDAAEAEDVTQEVFAQVWSQARRFDSSRGSVAAWLVMMARSRALDRLRRKQAVLKPGPGEHILAEIPDDTPSVELLAASEEEARSARAALAALPSAERTALELAYYEGLTQSEIAARTGQPLGTVKTRIRSALRRIREAMATRAAPTGRQR
jgi:RNA polymerase sigma-70 factor (ECF subfamily)